MRGIKIVLLLLAFTIPSMTVEARSYIDNETPIEIQIACNKYGEQYNICPELLEAICYQESRYSETAVDVTGECVGLMQVKASCHKGRMNRLEIQDLTDIDNNVHVGADYLSELFETYEDAGIVLGLYHGETLAIQNGRTGNYSNYVKSILENSERLERLHGK